MNDDLTVGGRSPQDLVSSAVSAVFEPALQAGLADALLAASADCVKLLDLDGRLLFMNEGGKAVMEIDDFAVVRDCAWPDFWQGGGNRQAREAVEAARDGRTSHFRNAADTFKGTPKYWDVVVTPVLDGSGRPARILAVSRDISEARRTEQRLLETARQVTESSRIEAENLRRLLHAAPSIMCVLRGAEHRFELMNEAALQLTGFRDLLGLTAHEAFPDAEGDALVAVLDGVYASGEPFVATDAPVKLQRGLGEAYEDAFLNLVFQPIRDDAGKVSGIFVEGTDITARVKAERRLAEGERRLRLAQEVAGIGSLEVDIATGETRGSEQFWRIWGLSPRASMDIGEMEGFVLPEDGGRHTTPETRAAGTAETKVEYRIRRQNDGEIRWLARHIEFIHDAQGKPVQMIGVVQDITERREVEEQRALLSRELEHRMKNTLSIVAAIAAQTIKGNDMERARTAFVARLSALSTANDILTARRWSSASIRAVVEGALAPHRTGERRLTVSGPDLWLTAKQSLGLALGLHELATNATKYGALSAPQGSVEVAWAVVEASGMEPSFRFAWTERGGPAVVAPARRGFGSRLIEQVLAADFDGEVRIEYGPAGVSCLLEAPLSALPEAAPIAAVTS